MSLFAAGDNVQPLAARMRPRSIEEFAGQDHLLGAGKPLRVALETGQLGSLILWGPPGCGKTTLAHLLARATQRAFVPFSAVNEGVPRIRAVAAEAQTRLRLGTQTVLFVDEIHRLNKGQQDSLLPMVEQGTVTLIGATTEAPSFEINGALLSRTRVFVLQPLRAEAIATVIRRALADGDRGLAAQELVVDDAAVRFLAECADGDARRALTALEAAAAHAGHGGTLTAESAREALQLRVPRYDRAGEEHFNLLSAYHKALRGSDPQGALYWMARMVEAGEDPMTLFRRAMAMAAEDVGLADPQALILAVAARDAFHMLGAPEGLLPLAEMTIYLATAPKANGVKAALGAAMAAAQATPAAAVPMHLRNPVTSLHETIGYGAGYQYAHDNPDGYIPQEYLPDELRGQQFYHPGRFGFEKEIAKRMEWWAAKRAAAGGGEEPSGLPPELPPPASPASPAAPASPASPATAG